MKKLSILVVLAFFIAFITVGQDFQQSTMVGAGLSYNTGIEYHHEHTKNPGVRLSGLYNYSESFRLSPAITFFFPGKEDFYDGTRTTYLWMVDLDGQYFLHSSEKYKFYALGGLSITGLNSNYKGDSPELYPDYSDQAIGLNIGGGANYILNEKIILFGEIKLTAGSYMQVIATVGILSDLASLTRAIASFIYPFWL